VNRSQIDMKHKHVIFEPGGKKIISRHNLHQHLYTCPIALPVRRNPQHRSLLTVVSVICAPDRASSANFERPRENFSTQL
jgi:hypothetical protein